MPAMPEGGCKLDGRISRLSINPDKGRAGKRRIKICSLSKQRNNRWLKILKYMAPDIPKLGL